MEQLQGLDASFLAMERANSPMHIGSILIYDQATAPNGLVRFKDFLKFTRDRMHLSKTMRQRLVKVPLGLDYPYWIEDPDFDLEYHIRHVGLPEPYDWRQLCILAARIFARPLDLNRPPWEYTIIGGLNNVEGIPKSAFAIVTKVHHAAIDGLSGIDLMEATHTLTPTTAPPNEKDEWEPEPLPNPAALFAKGYVKTVVNPVRQVSVAARAVPGVARTVRGMMKKEFGLDAARRAPKTRFNGKISPHRVVEGRMFPLADIKSLRALAEGCKVNDVFLAIIGGAMRRYLEEKGELPDASLTAMAPISVRGSGEKNAMGNQVAAMIAPLGTHIEDAKDRLAHVFEQTARSKAMTNALGARQMTEISKVSPMLFQSLAARLFTQLRLANRMKPVVNTVVTNVPGPPIPIYSSGAELVRMYGLICLFDGLGIAHVVQSYQDESMISFTACREMLPDPEVYAGYLEDSFAEYKSLLKTTAKTKRKSPARKRKPAAKKTSSTRQRAAAKTTSARKSPAAKTTTKKKPAAKPKPNTAATRRKPANSKAKTTKKSPAKKAAPRD